MNQIRVRFAPSPTGYLHVGGLRTALYNYLFARRHDGVFVLRIEDTDRKRFVSDAERDILESLAWAGISFDEGPGKGGGFAPYRQSERSDGYRAAAERLLADGRAYLAFDTEEELEKMRALHVTKDNPNPKYDFRTREGMRNALSLDAVDVERLKAGGAPHVVRLKVDPGRRVGFEDAIRGDVAFDTDQLDDQVLIKSDGLPTYHLANVVDDHEMQITHVIRGEEWLPSSPKHILLYEALGWTPPKMAHLPLILSPGGGKLSKRSADRAEIPVSVTDYRDAGYEPAALVNFLALLGWNPGDERELFSIDELVEAFSLERVGQSGVQFDMDKLRWFNEQYLRSRSDASLAEEFQSILEKEGIRAELDFLAGVAVLMRDRISFAADILEARYFFTDPDSYDGQAVGKRWKEDSRGLVEDYAHRIEALECFDAAALESALRELAEERAAGAGRIIHPVRLAVSGVAIGPGLFELLALLGRETTVRRLRRAAELLPHNWEKSNG